MASTPGTYDASLLALAQARPELAWPLGRDISQSSNAHVTNTRRELADALRSDHDWFEGDVGLLDGRVVMRHDADDPVVDLDLESWLRVVDASGRGAKVDIKAAAALPQILELVRRSGIPEHRIMFNVGLWPTPELLSIRRAFPNAIIDLSPRADAELSAADITRLQVTSRVVGGPLMFPIRVDLVDAGVVRALRPFGRVAIWNSPGLTKPADGDPARLRAMGVDGMIDLRQPAGAVEWLTATATGAAAHVFGWDAVHAALDAIGVY